jgi:hypothetical protein
MQIAEGKKHILVGGADEMSEHYFTVTKKTGLWKTGNINNAEILKSDSKGALCGEGVAFFMLSDDRTKNTYAEIKDLRMLYKPDDREINQSLHSILKANGMDPDDIDLILTGKCGDSDHDGLYDSFIDQNFRDPSVAYFKHLCGEFHSAGGFALWMAANILKENKIPEFTKIQDKGKKTIKHILIYNHYFNINHSLILLSAVD